MCVCFVCSTAVCEFSPLSVVVCVLFKGVACFSGVVWLFTGSFVCSRGLCFFLGLCGFCLGLCVVLGLSFCGLCVFLEIVCLF